MDFTATLLNLLTCASRNFLIIASIVSKTMDIFVSILPTPTEQTTTKSITMKHLESDQPDDFQVHIVYYIILGIVILLFYHPYFTIRDFYFRLTSQYHNSVSHYALPTNPVHQANIIEIPQLEGHYEDLNEAPVPPPLPTT
ncbi:hypothetical protein J6590_096448, partial [Homalodisca vitripennis]